MRASPNSPRANRAGAGDQGLPADADALRQIENIVIEEQVVDLLLEQAKSPTSRRRSRT